MKSGRGPCPSVVRQTRRDGCDHGVTPSKTEYSDIPALGRSALWRPIIGPVDIPIRPAPSLSD
ncbi:hypothetical protein C8Q76DRAFT_741640 [Earliella scabrosa]|nr:hypothetical protein C8Q76DRAFT_741640 [Earliella scabrosa]